MIAVSGKKWPNPTPICGSSLLCGRESDSVSIMRFAFYISLFALGGLCLTACGSIGGGNDRPYQPRLGQGQYIRPAYLDPELPPRLIPDDLCQARVYQTLVGQFEGSLYFQAIPGRKRIIKPAATEDFGSDFLPEFEAPPPLLEVRDFLAGQPLYAPSIRTSPDALSLEPAVPDRLTIEIDREGIVDRVSCG
jgi:hypothetical protein